MGNNAKIAKFCFNAMACSVFLTATPSRADPILQSAIEPADLAYLSAQMADAGRALGDPELLIAAARLRLSLPLASDAGPDLTRPAQAWLDEATALAPSDRGIAGRIDDARGLATRGRTPGPLAVSVELRPNGRAEFNEPFRANKPAIAFAETHNGASLRMTVRDPKGDTVCEDNSRLTRVICRWVPQRDSGYLIVLEATGGARVVLITN